MQRRVRSWWLLLPLAVATWALVHASGVHATVAGVLLGFTVPVLRRRPGPGPGLAEHFEHRFRPISAGVAVPVFAFFAAGRRRRARSAEPHRRASGPVAIGIVVGLVVGQDGRRARRDVAGAAVHPRRARPRAWRWCDVLGVALLAGIGFTVSLLIGELAFGAGTAQDDHVKIGVLLGSLIAALLAAVVLRSRATALPAHLEPRSGRRRR